MHEMITDKCAGDFVGPRMDKLVHDDVPPFPHMSHVTARDQLGGDMAPVESAVSRVTASVLETPWLSANAFVPGVGGGGSSGDCR